MGPDYFLSAMPEPNRHLTLSQLILAITDPAWTWKFFSIPRSTTAMDSRDIALGSRLMQSHLKDW